MIPFLDVHATYVELRHEIDEAIRRVLESGIYILGEEVASFEREFAAYCDASHCVAVGNGLDALRLGLLALGVKPGDEVIVPSNTYIATWLAVSQCGAIPVPVEPDERTHNLDPALVTEAISPRTRCILPVHLYGQPANLEPILAIAANRGIRVLEDAAQAHGSRYNGTRVGAHGDAVAWSFYPGKNLGGFGDGGAVTTNSAEVADRIRVLGNYGSREKYVHEVQGINSRLDPIQAATLRVKLRYLDEWNRRRQSIAELYLASMRDVDLVLPHVPTWAEPVWHLFVVRTKNRDSVKRKLNDCRIGSLIHYPIAPHMQRAYADADHLGGSLPIAERLANEVLSLPIGPHLSIEDAHRVCEATAGILGFR
jgi:dTDP-4-amino-4,6-dideoxygalactose transaminase